MARYSLLTGLVLLGLSIPAQVVEGQLIKSGPNLVDRLNTLRKEWTWRPGSQDPAPPQPVETWSGSLESTGVEESRDRFASLPRVDSQRLLPRQWQEAEAGPAAVAKLPRRHVLSDQEPAGALRAPSPRRASGGAAYRGSSRRGGGLMPLPRSRVQRAESSGAASVDVSTSRPSPKVRRSPGSKGHSDFDAETLRRELVDANGRSVPRPGERQKSVKTAGKSAVPAASAKLAAIPGLPGANPEVSRAAIGREVIARGGDKPLPAGGPTVVVKQSPLVVPSETAGPSFDEQRVTSAGRKAFAPEDTGGEGLRRPKASAGRVTSVTTSRGSAGPGASSENSQREVSSGLSAGNGLLATHQLPGISSQVSGPKHILIGREATFEVRFDNRSDVSAREVVAEVEIPDWVDVVDAVASNGVVHQGEGTNQLKSYRWQIQELGGQESETLELKVVPKSSRALELGVHWSHAGGNSEAVVEVQEPKLRIQISGPDEVFFDNPQVYRLTLTNPGTGVAEKVCINLLPPTGGGETLSTHEIGDLPPGVSKTVEVELTPREAGRLFVKATASARGDVNTEADKEIFCRKPELEVDWRGAAKKYAGTTATYYFRVRNPGTAAADDVEVEVHLPAGAEFVSGSEGHVVDGPKPTVTWRVGSLLPGDDRYMELKCILRNAGTNRFAVMAATADGDLADTKSAEVNVVALADLKLDVTDPKGPVPVGEDVVYEIRVRNRGENTAEAVDIAGLFSDGIDPRTVEGSQYSVADGRVTFPTIDKLEAGREIVREIHVRATQAGMHVFRAEVLCRDLEIKLAVEETTRFFADEVTGKPTSPKPDDVFQTRADTRY